MRYFAERAALASMLKNYSVVSLAWFLPVYAALGVLRVALLSLTRRFEDAYELLAAWGWNVVHLPGTLRRRLRAQSVRATGDRSIRRFMESVGVRLPRWFETVGAILEEQRELEEADEGQPVSRRLRHQGASLLRSHPVAVATLLTSLVVALAFRDFVGPDRLQGGALAAFPGSPHDFFRELVAGFRSTGLGGTQPGSPALALMGGLSSLLFRSPGLAQKVMLAALPVVAGVLAYRAAARQTGSTFAAVVAAAAYSLSGLVLWSISEGRIELLVAVALLPSLVDRLETATGEDPPASRFRWAVAFGALLAVAVSFFPGIALAVAVCFVVALVGGRHPARGLGLTVPGLAAAAILVFPMLTALGADGGRVLGSGVGGSDVAPVARLALGGGPGTGTTAWFLPVAAALALIVVRPEHSARAWRAGVSAAAGLGLAWLSGAGYLPTGLANAPAYLAAAAIGEATLVGVGVVSILGVRSESFGLRQILGAAFTVVVVGGIVAQSFSAAFGGWAVGGPEAIAPAWAVVASQQEGDYRVLWLGDAALRRPFPAPGGDPLGDVSGLRYAITGNQGVPALDVGRTPAGPGDDALRSALAEIMSGDTTHAGALLAPFGIRMIVGAPGDIPTSTVVHLQHQVDLDRVEATGLVIFRDAVAVPPFGLISGASAQKLLGASDPASIERLQDPAATPLAPVDEGYAGSGTGAIFLSSEFSSTWRVDGSSVRPQRAFGWATTFPGTSNGEITVRYSDQLARTIEMWILGALWAIALWITRKPVSR